MSSHGKNLAAVLVDAHGSLKVHEVEMWQAGANELLVRNELIAINPVEYKIAKLGIMSLDYPAILGSTFSGVIEQVGENVKDWKVGERVVVSKRFGVKGNQYGAWQKFVVVADRMISKIEEREDVEKVASLMMNATCVVGLFTGRLGFEKPDLEKAHETRQGTFLIYGGSSSFGRLAVRYLNQAGYEVVTTSSPKNHAEVQALGATRVIDHTANPESIKEQLLACRPYGTVVDMISLPSTIAITSQIVASQGGGKLYTMNPLPSEVEGVECAFEPWSENLYEDGKEELLQWVVEEYLTSALVMKQDMKNFDGGLADINAALMRVGGRSAGRVVVTV